MTETLEGVAVPGRLDVDICRARDSRFTYRDASETAPLGTLVGEFSLFNEWYEISSYWEGNFLERLVPGSFKRTINNRSGQSPVRVLLEHGYDPTVADKPLGVPEILEERETGPYAETPLFDTSYNRDLAPALAAGAYGQSFRFQVLIDEWVEEPGVSDHNPKGIPERTIKEVRLIEFGPTIFPASPATNGTTGLRSTTDEFYAQLARRDEGRYDAAIRSVRSHRAPAAPEQARSDDVDAPADPEAPTEDPPAPTHSEDSPDAPVAHSEDPQPAEHSSDTAAPSSDARKEHPVMTNDNMTTEERAARQSEIRARLAEIDTEYAGAALPDEVRTEWDSLLAEDTSHQAAIDAQESRREQLAALAEKRDAGEPGRPGTPAFHKRAENIYDLNEVRQSANGSVEDLTRRMRDNAKRAVELATFPGVASREDAQARVERALTKIDDEQGTLARRILTTGSPTYDRAFGKMIAQRGERGLSAEEQRALALGVDAEGGFAVPFQLDPTVILTSDGVIDPLRQLARVEQIVGKEWQGLTSEGITVTRKPEAAESTDDSPSFDQPAVGTSRVDGFVPFSVEIEGDWSAMRSELTMMLADAKATEEADSFVNGTGATLGNGKLPEGVLVGANIATNTDSGALTRDDLYRIKNALKPRFRANASWFAEGSFYDACRSLNEHGDVWAELAGDKNPRLLNKFTYEASEMPSFSTVTGSKLAIFGDFKRGFIIVDRVGMSVELVPQVFGANRRPTGQRGIWAFWRNGSKVLVPAAFRVLTVNNGS